MGKYTGKKAVVTGKPFPLRNEPAERLVLVIARRARYLALPFVHAPT
jgi:hypothetical protein